jgi:hypothetical protein
MSRPVNDPQRMTQAELRKLAAEYDVQAIEFESKE